MSEYHENTEHTFSPLIDAEELRELLLRLRNKNTSVKKKSPIPSSSSTYRLGGIVLSDIFGDCRSVTASSLSLPPPQEPEEDIWTAFERTLNQFPQNVFSDLPSDFAKQHDHYLYGTPKQ